jgi:hypothetical protein
MNTDDTKKATQPEGLGAMTGSVWFNHAPPKRGFYWVYEIGNPDDRPEIFKWDGDVFLTPMKWDRELAYQKKWWCAGPIRPPKIPTLNR